MTTIASRIATTIAIGTSFESPSARLDGTTAMTKQDLLGRVRGRRDRVGGEDRERDRLGDAAGAPARTSPAGGPTKHSLERVEHRASRLRAPRRRARAPACHRRSTCRGPRTRLCRVRSPRRRRSIRPRPAWTRRPGARRRHRLRPGGQRAGRRARARRPHGGSRRQERTRLPAAALRTSAARRSSGFGFDRDHLAEAGHRRGRRLRLRDERRQLQHPVRPHRPRDLRHRARRRPHLRPAPRAHLPAARHPDGRDRRVDDRPGAAAAAPGRDPPRLGRPDRAGRPRRAPDPGQGGRPEARRSSTGPAASGSPRSRGSARRRSSPPTWSARRATCSCSSRDDGRARRAAGAHRVGRRATDAGRDRRRRQRRAVHRQRPRRAPATRCC